MEQLEPIRFEMDRLVDYSDESILAELRRVAELLPPGPISRDAFNARARMSEATLRQRFGSWRAALEAAGLSDRYTRPGSGATADDVVRDLRRIATQLGTSTVSMAAVEQYGRAATARSISKQFGVLRRALEAAGLKPTSQQRRYTDDEYFENLLEVWTHYGRAPKWKEMDQPPSRITHTAYARKFGTWVKAKQAFVDKVNADIVEAESQTPDLGGDEGLQNRKRDSPRNQEDQREIPLGIRYQVLRRDNFKCILCGQSPATDPTVVLHVDHIFAFSRGGKTRLDNLRALCRQCNLGKGAAD